MMMLYTNQLVPFWNILPVNCHQDENYISDFDKEIERIEGNE